MKDAGKAARRKGPENSGGGGAAGGRETASRTGVFNKLANAEA
jgi:hypothetical protein